MCVVRVCVGAVMGWFVCVCLNVCWKCVVLVCVDSLSMCGVFCDVCNFVMGNCLSLAVFWCVCVVLWYCVVFCLCGGHCFQVHVFVVVWHVANGLVLVLNDVWFAVRCCFVCYMYLRLCCVVVSRWCFLRCIMGSSCIVIIYVFSIVLWLLFFVGKYNVEPMVVKSIAWMVLQNLVREYNNVMF